MSRLETFAVGDAANFVGSSENRDLAAELRELASPIERGEKVPWHHRSRAQGERPALLALLEHLVRQGAPHHAGRIRGRRVALEKKRRDDNRAELQQLWTRLVRLESTLAQTDPDFHRPSAMQGGND
jgi:hypothetical protein